MNIAPIFVGIIIALFIVIGMKAKSYIDMKAENKKVRSDFEEAAIRFEITKNILKEENDNLLARVRELEDGIKDTFAVSVRNEVTKVSCVFNKAEMAFLMAGVQLLLNQAKVVADQEYYIALYKKISKYIADMEEEEPKE